MDRAGFDDEVIDTADTGIGASEDALGIGTDERRMHVRAYNHWVSMLRGRAYPSIEDLDPASITDFGPHSVLLDFSGGIEDPAIKFLGRALREECGLDASVSRIGAVPTRSLLSRLTDHYLQIIANRAPIGFEAEFVSTRGHTTLYRGILMPFSSDEDTIDFIYGVINWKEIADAGLQAGIAAELEAAARLDTAAPPVWADGPSAGADMAIAPSAPLGEQLLMARESAAAARAADTRTRAALYRALGRAHDFALAAERDADGYQRLLAEAGIKPQARAPLTPVAKLVFGGDYDKTRLTEFAAVLSAAREAVVPEGGLVAFVEAHAGGIKGVVAAGRAVRRPAKKPAPSLADQMTLASVALDIAAEPGAPVLLLAHAGEGGRFDIVGALSDPALLRRALALHGGKG